MPKFLSKLTPFFMLGLVLVICFFGLILFAYLLVFGAILGLVLFTIAWIRHKFFPPKIMPGCPSESTQGRIIEHDDLEQ